MVILLTLYLIKHSNDKYTVEAETAQKAIAAWIDARNIEEKEVYQSRRQFKPNDFSIEKIGTYHGVIKASE